LARSGPFVDRHLGDLQSITLEYRTKRGALARGIRAETIPKICEVWLDADEEAHRGARQKRMAANAKVLMRALAHTGIIALVDEATGYQDVRAKDALAKIFTEFLANERQKWTSTFPLDFYKEIYRLRGWKFEPWNTKRPSVVASWTDDLVYDRLAPGLTDELRLKNPIAVTGRRREDCT
jgi:P63C domain